MTTHSKSKIVHEKYHKKTRSQSKIISSNNFTYKIILPILNKYITGTKNKVLDVGCGSGTISLFLADKGNIVHGIDISSQAIRACQKSAKNLGIKTASFSALDLTRNNLDSRKYNVILLLEVLEHLENDDAILRHLHSKLYKKGLLILSTPSINAPLHRLGLAKKFDKRVGHLRRYSDTDLKKKVKLAGFDIVVIKRNEGIVRNLLFTNSTLGNFVRFIKFFLVEWVTQLDNFSLKLFGESDFIIVAQKNSSAEGTGFEPVRDCSH